MSSRRSIFDSLRPSRRRKSAQVDEEVDKNLDEALQRLAEATADNIAVTAKVRRRQSSGQLKIVNVPTGG